MKEQKGKPIFKKWWFWLIVVIVVVAIASPKKPSETAADAKGTMATVAASTKQLAVLATPSAVHDWSSAEVTEANVRSAIKELEILGFPYKDEAVPKISIMPGDSDTSYKLIISVKPGTALDHDSFVRVMMLIAANYSKTLFTNPSVDQVTVRYVIELTDSYGKTEDNDASFITFSKETSQKIGYDKFIDSISGDYTRSYSVADKYFIHNSIYRGLQDKKDMPANK